jgi:hypothetical protein
MFSLMLVAAVVAFGSHTRADPLTGGARAATAAPTVLAAAKQLGVIPANCTMDPFKHVYRCCTSDSSGNVTCTEHPLDTKWPVTRLPQTQPTIAPPTPTQPGATSR